MCRPLVYDVWYSLRLSPPQQRVTLGSLGPNFLTLALKYFRATVPVLHLLLVAAVPWVYLDWDGNTLLYKSLLYNAPPPNGNARFNICLTSASLPVVRSGNSYVNVTRKNSRWCDPAGDTLEIRMTINHTSGTMTNLRFVDNLPKHTTMALGATDFIRIITNED
jgi:hypothetical protein